MKNLYQRSIIETPKDIPFIDNQIQQKQTIPKDTVCRDLLCAIFFIICMMGLLAMTILSMYSGNSTKIGQVVDSNNVPCGTGYNANYPYLIYPVPCPNNLTTKICISNCPSSAQLTSIFVTATPAICSITITNFISNLPTCPVTNAFSCSYYNSYKYLNSICLPMSSTNQVESNVQNNLISIGLSSVYNSSMFLIYIAGGVVACAWITFFLLICIPKIFYIYICGYLVGVLGIGFFSLKYAQLRGSYFTSLINSTNIVITDEAQIELLSFLCFFLYLSIFPILIFGYKRIKYIVLILTLLNKFFKRMVTMIIFNFILSLILTGLFGFQVFIYLNFFTYGNVQSSSSPFYSFTNQAVNIGTIILLSYGTYLLLSFTMCFSSYISANNFCIWYFEQTQQLAAFSPLKRSLIKAIKHMGTITLDAVLFPLSLVLFYIYFFLTDSTPQETIQEKDFFKYFIIAKNKIKKFFEIAYRYINDGCYPICAYKNKSYFQSNKQYIELLNCNRSMFFGVGILLKFFTTLFIMVLSVIGAAIFLYLQIYAIYNPPSISSLIVPLLLVLIFSLFIGGIVSSTAAQAVNGAICYFNLERQKIDNIRLCAQLVTNLQNII